MKSLSKIIVISIALAILAVSPAIAKSSDNQDKKNGQGKSQGNGQKGNSKKNDNHQEMYYAGIDRKQAKKYAKQYNFYGYKPLPPGIRKNLARGKPIPPGLAYNRLPSAYVATLPYYQGYQWRGYGADLVLVSIVTGVIADVLLDALD